MELAVCQGNAIGAKKASLLILATVLPYKSEMIFKNYGL